MKSQPLTKGQMEAKISEALSIFETNYMGRGPRQIRTYIYQDMPVGAETGGDIAGRRANEINADYAV